MTKHAENTDISNNFESQWSFLPQAALSLGFASVGVSSARPIPLNAVSSLRDWLAGGLHADMAFMDRTISQRENPRHPGILKDANAVVSAALPYGNGAMQGGIWTHIARHARGLDYHLTVKQKLHRLAAVIRTYFPECRYRIFTDSAPVAERTWAWTAGIGTIGKSGAVLVPKFGPKVVIGEIILSHVPEPIPATIPKTPFADCGACTACIDTCPTGAILSPGIIDSNRCLSYWTIERKQLSLPPDIEPHITSLFGCDTCTAVCPRNEIDDCALDPLNPMSSFPRVDLPSIVRDEVGELQKYFVNSALERTKWDMLRINARLTLHALEQGKTSCLNPLFP